MIQRNLLYDYFDYGVGWQYDTVPDELWKKILSNFLFPCSTAFGFNGVVDAESLRKFQVFSQLNVHVEKVAIYHPYNNANAEEQIALFLLTPSNRECLLQFSFAEWYEVQYTSPGSFYSDELVFWNEDVIFSRAVGSDTVIIFESLTQDDLKALAQVDEEIPNHLYPPGPPYET